MSTPVLAQRDQGQQPPDQSQPGQASQSEDQQQTQAFMGKVVKSKGGYVLRDDASGTTYKLDDADSSKHFVGKSVKVVGMLDPATSTIHVLSIEAGS